MRMIIPSSQEVVALTHSKKRVDGVSIKEAVMYFSKSFCVSFGIKAGQYAHFLNEGSEWRFIVNDDNTGFFLAEDAKKNGSLNIFSSGLCQLIKRTTGIEENVFCQIKSTLQELKEKTIFIILTGKPIKIEENKKK